MEVRTAKGDVFLEPSSVEAPQQAIVGTESHKRKQFVSSTGIIGFKGAIDLETGFVNKIEVIENQKRRNGNGVCRIQLPH